MCVLLRHSIRDLQPYRDAVQQATVVTRMGRKAVDARQESTVCFARSWQTDFKKSL